MRYSVEIYDKAQDVIKRRHSNAIETYNTRVAEIRLKAPEIAKLNDSLSMTSLMLTQAIISGGENTAKIIEEIKNNNLTTQKRIKEFLKAFSYPENYLEIPYTCSLCKDTGTVMGKSCECFSELLKKLAVEELNSKSKISLHDFDEFRLDYYPINSSDGYTAREQMLQVYNFCLDYTENFSKNSPSLLFKGNTGLGKTFLSSSIAKKLTEKGFSVVFDSIMNILRTVENEHFGRSSGDTMSLIVDADLVILDDMGSEFISNFTGSVLYNIINDRMNQNKPTIVSTNFSTTELNEKYNERIISRISSFIPIHFEGNDIRQIILKNSDI